MNGPSLWFAVQTKVKYEWVALDSLIAKGYECLLPSYRCKKRWANKVVENTFPLFPSYLFCRIDLKCSAVMGRVISTPGIRRIVSFGGKPVSVSPHEIEALQKLDCGTLPREPWDYIPIGTRVRIDSGPLSGVQGIKLPNSNNCKVLFSVSLLQRSVVASLEPGTVITPV